MKRILILAGIFLMCLAQNPARAQSSEQKSKALRRQVMLAINSSKTTDSLYNVLAAMPNKSPLITGYTGTLQALKAKHHWNPYYKVKYVKDAEKIFAKAVAADPHNMEIRFLRFSVDYKLPRLLGYTKNMAGDKDEIMSQLIQKNYTADNKELVSLLSISC
jgi:hypothetical protein